jgi:hypothetical protein
MYLIIIGTFARRATHDYALGPNGQELHSPSRKQQIGMPNNNAKRPNEKMALRSSKNLYGEVISKHVSGGYKEGIQQGKYNERKPSEKGFGKYQEGKYEQRISSGQILPKSLSGKYQEGIQKRKYEQNDTNGAMGKHQKSSLTGKDQYRNHKSYFSENDIEKEVDKYLAGKLNLTACLRYQYSNNFSYLILITSLKSQL